MIRQRFLQVGKIRIAIRIGLKQLIIEEFLTKVLPKEIESLTQARATIDEKSSLETRSDQKYCVLCYECISLSRYR